MRVFRSGLVGLVTISFGMGCGGPEVGGDAKSLPPVGKLPAPDAAKVQNDKQEKQKKRGRGESEN